MNATAPNFTVTPDNMLDRLAIRVLIESETGRLSGTLRIEVKALADEQGECPITITAPLDGNPSDPMVFLRNRTVSGVARLELISNGIGPESEFDWNFAEFRVSIRLDSEQWDTTYRWTRTVDDRVAAALAS